MAYMPGHLGLQGDPREEGLHRPGHAKVRGVLHDAEYERGQFKLC